MRAALFLPACMVLAWVGTLPADAAEGWVRLATPHFELYTDAGEKKGRDAILHFEQMRRFFEKASPVNKPADFPVRLILFRGETSYQPYRINAIAAAYFTSSQSRDYIVMGDTDAEVYKTALHEYMHLIIRHSGLKLPVWLNEGWADVYSTLRPASALRPGKGTAVGDMLPGRVQVLSREQWLPFEELTAVDQRSPVYNEANRAGIFYAESWALVHLLYLAPDYKAGFPRLVNALNQGHTAAEAFEIAWKKSSAEVLADLRGYLERKSVFGAIFPVGLERLAENPVESRLSEADADLMLGDLLAATGRYADAQHVFQRVAADHPRRGDVMQSLGYVAWARGDTETARQDFELAMEEGATDPKMFFHLAILERGAQKPLPRSQAALERAVALKPDYAEARLELGLVLLAEDAHERALGELLAVKSIDSGHAARLFNALAFAYARGGNVERARENVRKAQSWAKSDADKDRSAEILRWIAARESSVTTPPR